MTSANLIDINLIWNISTLFHLMLFVMSLVSPQIQLIETAILQYWLDACINAIYARVNMQETKSNINAWKEAH